jgi:hypothetical protein
MMQRYQTSDGSMVEVDQNEMPDVLQDGVRYRDLMATNDLPTAIELFKTDFHLDHEGNRVR